LGQSSEQSPHPMQRSMFTTGIAMFVLPFQININERHITQSGILFQV
jgi:hypothetical protein